MDAEARHRTLQLLGIELRQVPRDGDGDGFYSPWKGAPDRTPVPPKVPKPKGVDFGDLRAAIRSGEKARFPLRGGTMGDVFLVDHNNGMSTIEKRFKDIANTMGPGFEPKRQADAEQLASVLGQAIGAPVPRVLRTTDEQVSMDVVNGDRWSDLEAEVDGGTDEDKATLIATKAALVASRAGIRLGLLDVLTDNWDRANASNWYVDDAYRPVGIDHALAWSEASSVDGSTPPTLDLGPFAAQFLTVVTPQQGWKPPVHDWSENPLTPDDIDWLRERLADLEDDFAALGRHDWWEFVMARLDAIEPYAVGEESVFT